MGDARVHFEVLKPLSCSFTGNARLKLKVENTMRWRIGFDENGKAIKESNARMVKWSDGSYR